MTYKVHSCRGWRRVSGSQYQAHTWKRVIRKQIIYVCVEKWPNRYSSKQEGFFVLVWQVPYLCCQNKMYSLIYHQHHQTRYEFAQTAVLKPRVFSSWFSLIFLCVEENNAEAFFWPILPCCRKVSVLFESSHESPACPSDKKSIKIKMVMELNCRGKQKFFEKTVF